MPISYKGVPLNIIYYEDVYLKKIYMDDKLIFYPSQYSNIIFRWYRDYSNISKLVESQQHKDWVIARDYQKKLVDDARELYKSILLQVQIKHKYFEAEAELNESKRLEEYYKNVVAKTKAELEQAIKAETTARNDISRYESNIRDAERRYNDAKSNLESVRAQIPAAQSAVTEVSGRLQQAQADLNKAQSNLSTEQSNFAPINNEMQARETRVTEAGNEKDNLQQATQTSWNNYSSAKSTYNSAYNTAAGAESIINSHGCSANEGSVNAKLAEFQSQYDKARDKYLYEDELAKRYQEDVDDYQNTINIASAERDQRQNELYTQYVTNDPDIEYCKNDVIIREEIVKKCESNISTIESNISTLSQENSNIQNVEIPGYRTDYNNAKADEARIDQEIKDAEAGGAPSSVIEALKAQKRDAQQKQKDALANIKTAEEKIQTNNGKVQTLNDDLTSEKQFLLTAETKLEMARRDLEKAEQKANQNFLHALATDNTYQNAKIEVEAATRLRDDAAAKRDTAKTNARAAQGMMNSYSNDISSLSSAWNTYQIADAQAEQAKKDMNKYYSEWENYNAAYETAKTDYNEAVSSRDAYKPTYEAAKTKVDQAQNEYNTASSAYNTVSSEAQQKQSTLDNLLNQERQYKNDMYRAQSDKMSAESGLSSANANLQSALNTQQSCRDRLPGEEAAYNNSIVRRQNAEKAYSKAKADVQNDPDRIKAEQDMKNAEANYNKWIANNPEPTFGEVQTIKRYRWVYNAKYSPRLKKGSRYNTTIRVEWPKSLNTTTITLNSGSQEATGYSNTIDEDVATKETFEMMPRVVVSDTKRRYTVNSVMYDSEVVIGPVEA